MYRKDRCDTGSIKKDEGGVFIGVAECLQCSQVSEVCHLTMVEDVWVKIRLGGNRSPFIGVCYIPPDATSEDYAGYFDAVTILRTFSSSLMTSTYHFFLDCGFERGPCL